MVVNSLRETVNAAPGEENVLTAETPGLPRDMSSAISAASSSEYLRVELSEEGKCGGSH